MNDFSEASQVVLTSSQPHVVSKFGVRALRTQSKRGAKKHLPMRSGPGVT